MKQNRLMYLKYSVLGIASIFLLSACSGGGSSSSRVQIPSLMSPSAVTGDAARKNNEGVDHLVQGHYDVALKYFKEALAMKPNFAEAHFNMAISLDGMGKHTEATAAFKKAKEFGGENQKIVDSTILKKHLNL
ncbi:MAG: tetratricopeptide repeat protein [Nitrospiria bacterium]